MPDQVNAQVVVFPFTRQFDGNEVNIGRADGMNFLALPSDAVEILDRLAAGDSIGEAQAFYKNRYGELPDVEGLVSALEAEGFVRRATSAALNKGESKGAYLVRFHCSWFPQAWGQRIFSRPVLLISGVLVAMALLAIAADPKIVPGPSSLLFSARLGLSMLWLAPLFVLQICLHELSHMAAARSCGVRVRFGVSHRLWLLVLETDMSGVWTLPPRQRYLPILAGSFVDAVSASVMILILAAAARGLFVLSSVELGILRALLVIYFYQITWQCFLFVRTDFYYALANLFGCKNLLTDTTTYLRNLLVRSTGKGSVREQSAVPAGEMKIVRWYSILWLLGRLLAFYILIFFQIPIVYSYLKLMWRALKAALSGGLMVSPTVLVPAGFSLIIFAVGMFLWIRSMRSHSTPTQLETSSVPISLEKGV